jgi:hypothetical protein
VAGRGHARAAFDVDDYENFVNVQSEAAVRHLASSFAYDDATPPARRHREPTLLGSRTSWRRRWSVELQARLEQRRRRGRGERGSRTSPTRRDRRR